MPAKSCDWCISSGTAITEAIALSLTAITIREPKGWHHPYQGLRKNDEADGLRTAHAQRQTGAELTAAHREKPGPDHLGGIGAKVEGQRHDPRGHWLEAETDEER